MPQASGKKLPPGQRPIGSIMRWGIDHPGIGEEIPRIAPEKWILAVQGEVERPLTFSWREFMELPSVETASDFHCVEGWSVLDCRWKGVLFRTVVERAKPSERAKYVWFECADGYTADLELGDLLAEDVVLAYMLNREPLTAELGGPLRLLVPSKYAYKSPMWVTSIRFMSWRQLGYWELRGYSDTADVWKNDRRDRRWGI